MLRDGYPRIVLPQSWARNTDGQLPTVENAIVLAQWISEQHDTLTAYQHEVPDTDRQRFSIVWEPPGDAATRTIWASSFQLAGKHVLRVFKRACARDLG